MKFEDNYIINLVDEEWERVFGEFGQFRGWKKLTLFNRHGGKDGM